MFKTKLLVVALGAAFALPALAEDAPAASPLSFNVGVVSDYVFRGITQTKHEGAIQGGLDYAHSSGLYVGAWASNITWIKDSDAVATSSTSSPSAELDTYGGYKGTIATDLTYDVGAIRYNYLVNDYVPTAANNSANGVTTGLVNADTAEAYLGVSYKFLTLKYSYGLLGGFLTVPDAAGTNYVELNAAYPVGESGYTVAAHAGKQTYKGSFVTNKGIYAGNTTVDPSCTDYKLSVSKDFSGYVVGLNYTSTDVKTTVWTFHGKNWAEDTVAVSVLHAF
jgi:uncharacterized protein (TIGR02001 family)